MHVGAGPSSRSRRASPRLITCVAVAVFGSTLTGQRLFADLAPWTRPTTDTLVPLAGDGTTAFLVGGNQSPAELWRTDGTVAGTRLAHDPRRAQHSSIHFDRATVVNGRCFYVVPPPGSYELWVSDGTPAGTRKLLTVPIQTNFSGIGRPVPFGNGVAFVANTAAEGGEVWVSDGTVAGTTMIDTYPGTANGAQWVLGVLGQTILYVGGGPNLGGELFATDGSTATTRLVKDIRPGGDPSSPYFGVVWNGRLYFDADNGAIGRELWSTDGTPAGTALVRDIYPGWYGSQPRWLTATPIGVFASAEGPGGRELWISDGTGAGTRIVRDNVPDADPTQLFWGHGRLWYQGAGGNGWELWTSDGTAAGTVEIDLQPNGASWPAAFQVVGNRVIFSATVQPYGRDPWVSDGTPAGTHRLIDLAEQSGPNLYPRVGGEVVFGGKHPLHGNGLFVTDGTPSNTRFIGQRPAYVDSSAPTSFHLLGDRVAITTSGDRSLWIADGPDSVPTRLHSGVLPQWTVPFRHGLLMVSESRLWWSDGTGEGTYPLDVPGLVSQAYLTVAGDQVFFVGQDLAGIELWKTDGTARGTVRVADLIPGVASSYPTELTAMGDLLFFHAVHPSFGREVWVSDGTAAGTRVLGDNFPSSGSGQPGPFAVVGDMMFYNSVELWMSDGTVAGTRMVKDINPGTSGSWPGPMCARGETLLCIADDGMHGRELWMSDGTAAGTTLVVDLVPGPGGIASTSLVASGRLAYFMHDDGVHGRELWCTDGTAAGTVMVRDVAPGSASGIRFRAIVPMGRGGHVMFYADDGTTGDDPWITDGTAANTRLLVDGDGGVRSSGSDILVAGAFFDHLFFAFEDLDHGQEPWVLDLAALGAAPVTRYGWGCAGTGGRPVDLSLRGSPVPGASLDFRLGAARPAAPAVVLLGGGTAGLGLTPACAAWVTPPWVLLGTTTTATGRASLRLPPLDVGMVGQLVAAQAAVLDPQGAHAGLLAWSNAVALLVGR